MNTNFLSVIGYLVGVAGAITVVFSKVKTDNLNDLKDRVDILEKELEFTKSEKEKERETYKKELAEEIKTRQELHLENQKSIANLQGQLATYKEIPLKSIAKSLEELATSNKETSSSNALILQVLQKSAIIAEDASHDGGLLVKTKKTNPLDVKVKE